jgi:hypothetical protein
MLYMRHVFCADPPCETQRAGCFNFQLSPVNPGFRFIDSSTVKEKTARCQLPIDALVLV